MSLLKFTNKNKKKKKDVVSALKVRDWCSARRWRLSCRHFVLIRASRCQAHGVKN